ncbi:hypothetical protein CIK05_06910 [Bdellovibrio sp. qaytius]|nr:hypothetical protein CIK05_06910 [Bdellovibrio sp. qaytius]
MKKAVITILLAPMLAHATMTPDMPGRGAERIALDRGETCYVPNRLEGAKYSKKDLGREQELCSMNISASAAVCGKVESTNPALEFFEIAEGWTAAQMEAKNCFIQKPGGAKDDNAFKKLAKYKLSTSCSYTPSLLAYYHVSRFLGNINQVPPAVLRTVDASIHRSIGTKALVTISDKSSLIAQTWTGLLSILTKGSAHSKATNVFTDDYKYSFGALQYNPTKEERYSEMLNGGTDQLTRTANFKAKNSTYINLTKVGSLASLGLSGWSEKNAQEVLKMQNVADMILLDTMLSQQDRLGNLHYTMEPYMLVTQNGKTKVDKLDSLSKKDLASGQKYPAGTIMLKKMMMKDNDCGVAKENHIKNGKLLEGLRHFNPETFEKLIKLMKLIDTAEGKAYFKKETAMSATDIDLFEDNVEYSLKVLVNACKAGQLTLDLDLDSAFAGQAVPDCRAVIQAAQQ